MTIKGRSKDVRVPFSIKQATPSSAQIDGGLTLKRLEWGIGEGVWSDTETVADEVEVRFRFTVSGKKRR